MRLYLLFLFLCFASIVRADTLRVVIQLPGNLSRENKLQVDSLLDNLKDKSSLLILSHNSDISFQHKLTEYLQQKGIVVARIKMIPAQSGTGDLVDIIYSPGTREPNIPLPEDLKSLIQNAGLGQTLALKNIQFVGGQAVLKKEAFEELSRLYEILKADKKLKIQIEGHICCLYEQEGDTTTKGYKLSVKRAETVYKYLLDNGIAASRVSYKGFSSWRRIRKEVSAAEEEANRRVEIRIMDK